MPDISVEITSPPPPIGEDEYKAVEAAIAHNVEQGLKDPLIGLSDETELDLVRLAFHDTMRLDRLERGIKARILELHQSEALAKEFNLGTYRRSAKQLEKKIAAAISRRQKMAARNLKVIENSQLDETLGAIPEDTPTGVAADMYSNSPYLQSVGWLMAERKGRIWYDEFYNAFYTDWGGEADDRVVSSARVDDVFLRRVHTTLQRQDVRLARSSYGNSERAIYYVGAQDVRNEPRDWIKSLTWDGVERIPRWLHHVYGVEADQYHADVGRCWMVSMAARIMSAGCKVDTMPVLIGPQGNAKSTSLAVLGGDWYAAVNVSAAKEVDFLMTLAGLLVAEIAELDALFNKRTENTRVKALLSTFEDVYRPPYGRTTGKFKRTAVLAGTTNDMDWHRDDTGGRRFWPIICQFAIDLEWLRANREQLFAEALERYRRGEKWWDVGREEQERRLEVHHSPSAWQGVIEAWLASPRLYKGPLSRVEPIAGDAAEHEEWKHWGTIVTVGRICASVLQIPIERQNRAAKEVARHLRKAGWETTPIRCRDGTVLRGWVPGEDTGTYRSLRQGDDKRLL